MEIEFQIYANLRQFLGFKIKKIEVEKNITVLSVLNKIRDSEPNGVQFYKEIIDADSKKLVEYVKIIINGHILFADKALSTVIDQEGTIFAVFPPIGGG